MCILNANVLFAPLLLNNGIELEAILATKAPLIIDFETLLANNISVKLAIFTIKCSLVSCMCCMISAFGQAGF